MNETIIYDGSTRWAFVILALAVGVVVGIALLSGGLSLMKDDEPQS